MRSFSRIIHLAFIHDFSDDAARSPPTRMPSRLFRLALEGAPAGAVLHGVAEEGVPARTITAGIGHGVGVPAASVDPADAAEHFGWICAFFAADIPASGARTRASLGWEPVGPTLPEDLDAGSNHAAGAAPVTPA